MQNFPPGLEPPPERLFVRVARSEHDALTRGPQKELDAGVTGEGSDVGRVDPIGVPKLKDGILLGMDSLTEVEALPRREAGPGAVVLPAVRSAGGDPVVANRERPPLLVYQEASHGSAGAGREEGVGRCNLQADLIPKPLSLFAHSFPPGLFAS